MVEPSYALTDDVPTIFSGVTWVSDPADAGQVIAVWTVTPDDPLTEPLSGEQEAGAYSAGIDVSALPDGDYTLTVEVLYRTAEGDYPVEGTAPVDSSFTIEPAAP